MYRISQGEKVAILRKQGKRSAELWYPSSQKSIGRLVAAVYIPAETRKIVTMQRNLPSLRVKEKKSKKDQNHCKLLSPP